MRFPRGSAIGLFGMFGRSEDLRRLDDAFRDVDVHPRLVTEAIKLTVVRLLKDAQGDKPEAAAYRRAAELVGYCIIGANAFGGANGEDLLRGVEQRMQAAIEFSSGLDARLVLLTLHAKAIQPSVVEAFGLEADEA